MNWLYVLTNVSIALGYVFAAIAVAPHLEVRRYWVAIAGAAFLFTCGLTHADKAAHALFDNWPQYPEFHSQINSTAQMVAIWAFVVGLYFEFVSDRKRGQ